MNKCFLIFSLLGLLISFVFSKVPCGFADVFSCPDDNTCCMGHTGWKCYPIKNAICCADLITACAQGQTCDNENHKCEGNAHLTFLN